MFSDSKGESSTEAAALIIDLTQAGGPGTAISLSGTVALAGIEIPEAPGYVPLGLAMLPVLRKWQS